MPGESNTNLTWKSITITDVTALPKPARSKGVGTENALTACVFLQRAY